jgi:hypothetical protein
MTSSTVQLNSLPINEQHDIRACRSLKDALVIDDLPVKRHFLAILVDVVEFYHELKLTRTTVAVH